MGSSQQAIKVVIIDLRGRPQDFIAITKADGFSCNYYDSYDTFIQNQSLKELSYIIIREKERQLESKQAVLLNQKIRQSSVVAKTYRNLHDLQRQFNISAAKNEILLREKLISYIRKYSLERLVIYLLVENVLNFKLPEYEQPYITLIADNVEAIKQHLYGKPKGAQPTIFKFRRLVKDLYRRTVVKVLDTNTTKEVAEKNKKEWGNRLGSKINMSFSSFNEEQFEEGLISNYYDYIVVDNGKALTFIQDMKKVHKFESELIYLGNIDDFCKDAQGQQNESKLKQIKSSLWMHSQTIASIAQAIKNCTDIKVEQTEIVARNVVIFTLLDYGLKNEEFIVQQLLRQLQLPAPKLKKLKSKDISQPDWHRNMKIKVVSQLERLKQQFKKAPFSYLITFDCPTDQIETVKAYLRQSKYDKRVYMYNAEEDTTLIQQIQQKITDTAAVRQYLAQRVQKVAEKAAFRIKFEIGPIEEITTYQLTHKENAFFSNEMGLITSKITCLEDFQKYYMSQNRQRIIAGFCMVLRAQDYFAQWKKLLEIDTSKDSMSYFGKVKIILLDDKTTLKQYWKEIKEDIQAEKIAFVHYNLARVREFLEIMPTPRINLTVFVKKALPKFYKAYQKLIEYKFKRIELTASIVSKSSLLKEVFEDDNFKLSKHHRLSFLKLSNTSKNIQESLTILNQQFLLRYGMMWRAGYEIVTKDKKSSLDSLRENIKLCLYKCKAYSLLNVSQEEFDYFYLQKLDQCRTYLDLHITMIYMFSLPHGLANVIQLIFSDPLSTCLTPKIFVSLVVALLVCFCSFQDEVMKKKRFLVYMDDTNKQQFLGVMKGLKRGDVLFNNCFLFAGTDQGSPDNANNNCLFLEFEDIPMLSDTHIKQYLHMEPFSFYKESTEYLIAPYTQFTVKNIENNIDGKVHVTLGAVANSKQGFVAKVFEANQIKEETLFQIVVGEVSMLKSSFTESDHERIKEIRSLYKKAQLIALYEQKVELMKSIKEGLEYKRFIQAMRNKKVLQALSHLKKKEQSQKSTTELQAAYFKKMLGVEKALLYYTLCEYDISMNQLEKVIKYLTEQNVQSTENWLIKKVKSYQQNVNDLNTKRHKYLNRFEKTKYWKIEAHQIEESNKVGVSLSSKKMQWKVGYNNNIQQFYIENSKDKYYYYNALPAFGETATAFPNNSAYQTLSQREQQGQTTDLSELKSKNDRQNYKQKKLKSPKNASQLQSQVHPIGPRDQSSFKRQNEAKHLQAKKEVTSDWLFKTDNAATQNQPVKELPVNSRVLKKSEQKEKQTTSFEFLPEADSNMLLSESQIAMGVSKEVAWQAFFFDGKFVLQQKGKHFKVKVPNKHHF